MKTKEFSINQFDGGRSISERLSIANQFSNSLNFDIYTDPKSLIPVRDWEADDAITNSPPGSVKVNDLAVFGNYDGTIFAVGKGANGVGTQVWSKAVSDQYWATVDASDGSSAEDVAGSGGYPAFILSIFNSSGSRTTWFTNTKSNSIYLGLLDFRSAVPANFTKVLLTAASTRTVPQGIVGVDGNLYVSEEYNLIKCATDTTVTNPVFSVSPNYTITSLATYGNYLAIAIRSSTPQHSKILLWNYAEAQASEVIELGVGNVSVIENINGYLVAVVDNNIATKYANFGNGTGSMQIKIWNGSNVETINEVKAFDTLTDPVPQYKYKRNNVLYWYAKIPQADGSYLEGIWSFGRPNASSPWALSLNRAKAGSSFEGFWGFGDYLYAPNSGDGSVSRTSSTAVYPTATYETQLIYDEESVENNLLGVTVTFQPLTAGQGVVLRYKKDSDTGWTAIDATPNPTTGELFADFAAGLNFKEIKFQVETTGGAKPTSVRGKYEPLSSALQ